MKNTEKENANQSNQTSERIKHIPQLYKNQNLFNYAEYAYSKPDMSSAQFLECIIKSNGGDADARNKIFITYMKYVFSILAYKFHVEYNDPEIEDYLQQGFLGLNIAITRCSLDYAEKDGYCFSSYASYWIRKYISQYMALGQKPYVLFPFDANIHDSKIEQCISFKKRYNNADPTYQAVEDKLFTINAIRSQDKEIDKQILKYILEQKHYSVTHLEIAKHLCVSRQYISKRIQHMRNKNWNI